MPVKERFGFPVEFQDKTFDRGAFVEEFVFTAETNKYVDFLTNLIINGDEDSIISSTNFMKTYDMGQIAEQLYQDIVSNNTDRSEEDCWKCVNFIISEMYEGIMEFQEEQALIEGQ